MYRRIMLAIVLFIAAGTAGAAADLSLQSPLGAVFAEPAPYPAPVPAPVYAAPVYGYSAIYAPPVDIRPLVAGYYGKPNSYIYAPYYGDSRYWDFARLPYACGFHGYC